jgi:hypothetical protein
MSMKISTDTIGYRTRDLPCCSALPQPTVPPAACPHTMFWWNKNFYCLSRRTKFCLKSAYESAGNLNQNSSVLPLDVRDCKKQRDGKICVVPPAACSHTKFWWNKNFYCLSRRTKFCLKSAYDSVGNLKQNSSVLLLDVRDGKKQRDGKICVKRFVTFVLK